jgi:hypothetical protein
VQILCTADLSLAPLERLRNHAAPGRHPRARFYQRAGWSVLLLSARTARADVIKVQVPGSGDLARQLGAAAALKNLMGRRKPIQRAKHRADSSPFALEIPRPKSRCAKKNPLNLIRLAFPGQCERFFSESDDLNDLNVLTQANQKLQLVNFSIVYYTSVNIRLDFESKEALCASGF